MELGCRLVTIKDAEVMTLNRNRHRECFFHTHEVTLSETRNWIERISKKYDDFTYIIYEKPTGLDVAQFGVCDIVKNKDAEIVRILRYDEYKHYSLEFRDICGEVLKNIGDVFDLKKIRARVYPDNTKSIWFLESLGFEFVNTVDTGSLIYNEMELGVKK